MKSFFSNLVLLNTVWIFIFLNTGCGVALGPRAPRAVAKASYQGGYWNPDSLLSESEAQGEFECPTQPNVIPKYDWDIDGTNRYRVCESPTSTANLLIFGIPSGAEESNMICVFPLQYIDRTHVFVKPDIARGGALFQCVKADQASGANVSFTATNFNMVLIVESKDLELAQECLNPFKGVDFTACPHYSYGRFR